MTVHILPTDRFEMNLSIIGRENVVCELTGKVASWGGAVEMRNVVTGKFHYEGVQALREDIRRGITRIIRNSEVL